MRITQLLQKLRLPAWLTLFLSLTGIPLVLCWYEILFHLSTQTSYPFSFFRVTFLFSFGYGLLLLAPLRFLTQRFGHHRLFTSLWLVLMALPFLIEYFVFLQFKIFYDVKTVFGGAKDAVGGFQSQIFRLIFSRSGLSRIFLYALPLLLYLFFTSRSRQYRPVSLIKARFILLAGLSCAFLAFTLVRISPDLMLRYKKEYNFQNAVSGFGLLTGVRLDILTGGKTDVAFEEVVVEEPVIPQRTAEPETEPAAPEEPDYEARPHMLDIDFEYLSRLTSGTKSDLDLYVASQEPACTNRYTGLFKGKNLIFLTAEAFSAEVIDPELTPTLYRLATKGIQFTDYYQPASAGTTGGEYENIFGLMPTDGGLSMKDTADRVNFLTMGWQLNRLGYNGWAFHNNDYTFYSRNETHNNLGYSHGFLGFGNGMEEYLTDVWPRSDLEMMEATVDRYIDEQPFNVYYMTVSGHNDYSFDSNAQAKKNWEQVQDLDELDRIKAYLAANLELEKAMTYLVDRLEEAGIADDTVIVLGADHFPYGLDDDPESGWMPYLNELYGYEVTNSISRDHNRLILWSGALEKMDPIIVDTPVSSVDILPTLFNLFDIEYDSRLLIGRDVFSDGMPLVFEMTYDWKTTLGTYIHDYDTFYPADPEMDIPEGYVESVKAIVRNKIAFSTGVLDTDYFAHALADYYGE